MMRVFRLLAILIAGVMCSAAASNTRAGATPGGCTGDCNGDAEVTVDEIITGVAIALALLPLGVCAILDSGGDGAVSIDELIIAVRHAQQGCAAPGTPTPTPTQIGPPTRTPTPLPLELFDVGPNFFSIRKPRGWDIHIAGICSTLGILIRDPAEPLRQAFYFGLIGPVYLTEQQRQIDLDYIRGGGFNFITWLDAPAVNPLTVDNFFAHWPEIAAMEAATAFLPQFPELANLTVVSTTPLSSSMPGATSALVRAVLLGNGAAAQGQLVGSTWVLSPFTGTPGGGTAYGSIVLGLTGPAREYPALEPTLVACLESFTVTQNYVTWCRQQQAQLWGAVARAGQTLSETSDLIFDGWRDRTQSSDIVAERTLDTLRSVDRVYDPSTNQVYEVPLGWYADYDLDRDRYTMSGLQPLPPDSYPLWSAVPAPGSAIH